MTFDTTPPPLSVPPHSFVRYKSRRFLLDLVRVIEVQYHRGLYLPEIDLWLDPQGAKPRAFVSHAHADHFARHESIICSETTGTLIQNRFRASKQSTEALAYHVPLTIGDFRIKLLPAGHIPGSAMIHITRTSDNATLLYTGDFKTRRSRTAEAASFLTADTLIMETTFGMPGYAFPNQMEVEADLLRFINDCFSDGETPVLLGYSLGKAQEALALLEENNIPALLHPAAAAMTRTCREAGVPGLPEPEEFTGTIKEGHVLIVPPHALKSKLFKDLTSIRTAMLSGWALRPGAKYRYGVDAMIPFSDHADFPGLMECIQRVRPKQVLTVHGFAKEFATELRSQKFDAWCAAGGDQLELGIHRPAPRPIQASRPGYHNRVLCQLTDFTDVCRLVEKTGSRTSKVEFISSYLKTLDHEDDLIIVMRLFTEAQLAKDPAPLNATTLRHAIAAIPGAREERYHESQLVHKDFVRTASLMLQELQLKPQAMTLAETDAFVSEFCESKGSINHIERLTERLMSLHPAEGEILLKLIVGNRRLGLDSALIAEIIAKAFDANAQDVVAALENTPPGQAALLAKRGELKTSEPRLFTEQPVTSTPEAVADHDLLFPE